VIVLRQESCEWAIEDAMVWKAFLATGTGRKLLVVVNDSAICRRGKTAPSANAQEICYQAGMADGAASLIDLMSSLQPDESQRGETEGEDDGETTPLP
jgi:hypothetical protein